MMIKIMNSKKKMLCVFVVIVVVVFFVSFLYRFFIGSITIRTKSDDYCNFEGFLGYSNLEIFPANPLEICEVTSYYYCCMDTFMDPTCKVLMECSFSDDELFKSECDRLSQITVEKDSKINEIEYNDTLFKYPVYIAMYNWSSCYEYALILEEENKIVYIFLQGDFQKVNKEYMPLNASSEHDKFSIYSFDGSLDLKYR